MSLITITHNYGSNGMDVARKVAQELGWKLYDDRELQELIRKRGIAPEEISQLDEKAPGYWDLFFRSRPQLYLNVLESVIYDVARTGDGVIIGHGSQVLLKHFDCAFHVRLFSPESRRVEDLAARQGLNREAAWKLIRKHDREQAGFFKFAFQLDLDDASLYDLIINTQKFDAGTAASLIISAARSEDIRACSLNVLESMERLSLEKKVNAALIEHRIDPGRILVEVPEKGVAQIAGVSPNDEDKKRIESIVGRVPGVSKVVSGVGVIKGGL
jgi:cytidylate kinase